MGTININGDVYRGQHISIINGVVTIDGVRQDNKVSGVVEVRVLEGSLVDLTTDASVQCGLVTGSISAGGSVNCGDVRGSVNAGGSVRAGDITGSVNAGGSVRYG